MWLLTCTEKDHFRSFCYTVCSMYSGAGSRTALYVKNRVDWNPGRFQGRFNFHLSQILGQNGQKFAEKHTQSHKSSQNVFDNNP